MRPIGKLVVHMVLICMMAFSFLSCGSQRSEVRHESIIGDYLFDRKDINAVVYTTVYEEDGILYTLLEMSDYPVEMKRVKPEPPTYRIKFKSTGDFNLVFSQLESGCYSMLSMTSNDSDFLMEGRRSSSDIHRLGRETGRGQWLDPGICKRQDGFRE